MGRRADVHALPVTKNLPAFRLCGPVKDCGAARGRPNGLGLLAWLGLTGLGWAGLGCLLLAFSRTQGRQMLRDALNAGNSRLHNGSERQSYHYHQVTGLAYSAVVEAGQDTAQVAIPSSHLVCWQVIRKRRDQTEIPRLYGCDNVNPKASRCRSRNF
jgi:hypothetical protein